MTLARMMTRPCTIVRRIDTGEKDRRGNVKKDPVEVKTVCELQQQPGFRSEDESEVSNSRWLLYLPADQEIGLGDAVQVEGEGEFEVYGEPWKVWSPRLKGFSHIELESRRTVAAGDVEPA